LGSAFFEVRSCPLLKETSDLNWDGQVSAIASELKDSQLAGGKED
jgi:hypothetical protein